MEPKLESHTAADEAVDSHAAPATAPADGASHHDAGAVDTHTETATASHEGKSTGGMPQLDPTWFASQIFWLVITFVALYVVMARKVIPMMADVIESRQNKITHDLERAELLKREAEILRNSHEKTITEARNKAQNLLQQVQGETSKTAAAKAAEQEAQLTKDIQLAETRIANDVSNVRKSLIPIAADIAAQIVEKITQTKPSGADAEAAVRNYVKIKG